MIFEPTPLADAFLIKLEPRGDNRGIFARTMCRDELASHGIVDDFVQQNMSVTAEAGTVRGMHFQRPPHGEAKLIRCVRGAIRDVIIDLRPGSPSYMRHAAFDLNDDNRDQLFIPAGFAHGFQTLVDDVEMTYLMSAMYAPSAEGGLRHDDPALGIEWPMPVRNVSPRDAAFPLIDAAAPPAL